MKTFVHLGRDMISTKFEWLVAGRTPPEKKLSAEFVELPLFRNGITSLENS